MLFSSTLASADVDPLEFTETLHLYRELERRFMVLCYGTGEDGESGFLENHTFSNATISPDDGVINCNAQLQNLTELQEQLKIQVEALRAQGQGVDPYALVACENGIASVEPVDPSTVSNAEEIEREASFNTTCEFTPESAEQNRQCGNFVKCKIATGLLPPLAALEGALSTADSLTQSNLPGTCNRLVDWGEGRSCLETMQVGIGDGVDGFFGMMSGAARRFERLAFTVEGKTQDYWDREILGRADYIASNVEWLTESEQQMVDWAGRYFAANDAEQSRMLNNAAAAVWNGLNEAAKNGYGCEQFEGGTCIRPMVDWCQASCQAKVNSVCGVIGAVGAEAVLGAAFGGIGGAAAVGFTGFRVTSAVGGAARTAFRRARGGVTTAAGRVEDMISGLYRRHFPDSDEMIYARRMGEIRRLNTSNRSLASLLAVRQAGLILDGPVGTLVRTAGRNFIQRRRDQGAFSQTGSSQFFDTSNFDVVDGRLRVTPGPKHEVIVQYQQLSEQLAQRASSSGGALADAQRGFSTDLRAARDGYVERNIAQEFEIENPEDYYLVSVQYTEPGTGSMRWGRIAVRREGDGYNPSDLFDTSNGSPRRPARAPASPPRRVQPPPEPTVVTGNRFNRVDGALQPDPPDVIESQLLGREFFEINGGFARDLSRETFDVSTLDATDQSLRRAYQLYAQNNPELDIPNGGVVSSIDDIPADLRDELVDTIAFVNRRQNPDLDEQPGIDAFYDRRDGAAEFRLTTDSTNDGLSAPDVTSRNLRTGDVTSPVDRRQVIPFTQARRYDEVLGRDRGLASPSSVTPSRREIPRISRFEDIPEARGLDLDPTQRLLPNGEYERIESITIGRRTISSVDTINDINRVIRGWPEAHRDDIFDFLKGVTDKNRRRQYFAILLGDNQITDSAGDIIRPNEMLSILKDAQSPDTRQAALDRLEAKIREQGDILYRPGPDVTDDAIRAAENRRGRLQTMQQIILRGDDYELGGVYSTTRYNALQWEGGGVPHAVDDTFGLQLVVREGSQTTVFRGANPDGSSGLIGGYYRTGTDRSQRYETMDDYIEEVAAFDDYQFFFGSQPSPGTTFSLHPNAAAVGYRGDGHELLGRTRLDDLRATTVPPVCSNAAAGTVCRNLFDLQQDLNMENLRRMADGGDLDEVQSILRRTNAEVDAIIDARINTPEVQAALRNGESIQAIMSRLKEVDPELASALRLRLELRSKQDFFNSNPRPLRDSITEHVYDVHASAMRGPGRLADGSQETLQQYAQRLAREHDGNPVAIRQSYVSGLRNHPLIRSYRSTQSLIDSKLADLRAANTPAERLAILEEVTALEVRQKANSLAIRQLAKNVNPRVVDPNFPQASLEFDKNLSNDIADDVEQFVQNFFNNPDAATTATSRAGRRGAGDVAAERVAARQGTTVGEIVQRNFATTDDGVRRANLVQDFPELDGNETAVSAVIRAHNLERPEGVSPDAPYTPAELRAKNEILRDAGITDPETRLAIIQTGYAGSAPMPTPTTRVPAGSFQVADNGIYSARPSNYQPGNFGLNRRVELEPGDPNYGPTSSIQSVSSDGADRLLEVEVERVVDGQVRTRTFQARFRGSDSDQEVLYFENASEEGLIVLNPRDPDLRIRNVSVLESRSVDDYDGRRPIYNPDLESALTRNEGNRVVITRDLDGEPFTSEGTLVRRGNTVGYEVPNRYGDEPEWYPLNEDTEDILRVQRVTRGGTTWNGTDGVDNIERSFPRGSAVRATYPTPGWGNERMQEVVGEFIGTTRVTSSGETRIVAVVRSDSGEIINIPVGTERNVSISSTERSVDIYTPSGQLDL